MSTKVSPGHVSTSEAILETARRCSVDLVNGVAGYPVTSLMDDFMADSRFSGRCFWMTSEKEALEMALGASVAGRRALVLVKHVGMNVLCDPLVSSVTHTIGAGVVIIAGDDPAVAASQNGQDSRHFGELARVAVFDPAGPQDAATALRDAFEISEHARVPAILRITSRLLETSGPVEYPESPGPVASFDPSIWDYTMKGKQQLFYAETWPRLVGESEKSAACRVKPGNTGIGIISSGYVSSLVDGIATEAGHSHLPLCMVSPFPYRTVREFIDRHDRVLVAEETETFIESRVCIDPEVKGKLTGHLGYGEITGGDIADATGAIGEETVIRSNRIETITERGPRPVCEDCPFMPLYRVLGKLDVPVAGDIGCSIRSASPPLRAVDTGFALGSAISVACGFGTKGIAVIGDFALAHSGIVGLVNAVHIGADVLIIILKNRVAAMTGGQEVPDLTGTVRSLVGNTVILDSRKASEESLELLLRDKLGDKGISVIILEGDCPKHTDAEEI
jgi:indolepyruvate ferredoxin oxidoreductase alpha subunit